MSNFDVDKPEKEKHVGSLFKNAYKEQGDKKPDFTGTCCFDGVTEEKISAWIRTSQSGKQYIFFVKSNSNGHGSNGDDISSMTSGW